MKQRRAGFTIIELLVSILVTSIMMAAIVSAFAAQNRAFVQQDNIAEVEENLRTGMLLMSDALRSAGYGVPTANLSTWLQGYPGAWGSSLPVLFTTPSAGKALSIVSCTSAPVATLTADAPVGATSLTVNSTSELATNRAIWINRAEFLRVTGVSGSTITVDSNPLVSGNQGLSRVYYAGAPICRLDVTQFVLITATGEMWMYVNGTSLGNIVEHLSDIQFTAETIGKRYRLDLTGKTTDIDTGYSITRTLTSEVLLTNRSLR
ncbi:MAG: PilW family protein [Candidatus Binatia bacterium]